MEAFQQLGDLHLPAEEYCRILLRKRLKTWERRPVRDPGRSSQRRQALLRHVLPHHQSDDQQQRDARQRQRRTLKQPEARRKAGRVMGQIAGGNSEQAHQQERQDLHHQQSVLA